jgi:hypothetical protein
MQLDLIWPACTESPRRRSANHSARLPPAATTTIDSEGHIDTTSQTKKTLSTRAGLNKKSIELCG